MKGFARAATVSAAVAGVLAVWCAAALASYTVPGSIPSTDGVTWLPVTGSITVDAPGGTTTGIAKAELGSQSYNGVNNVFTQHYWLFFYGADGRIAGGEQVVTGPVGTYTFNDTAGTLTVRVQLPPSLVVDTLDPDTGWLTGPGQVVDVTSGSGTWTVIYQADTSAQRKTLISNHKACDQAAARNRQFDRANAINNTILALVG